jgi:hypothetical protein
MLEKMLFILLFLFILFLLYVEIFHEKTKFLPPFEDNIILRDQ